MGGPRIDAEAPSRSAILRVFGLVADGVLDTSHCHRIMLLVLILAEVAGREIGRPTMTMRTRLHC